MKILVAEDDAIIRTFLRASLNKWGYEILEAEDGQSAWEILESDPSIQFVITDWMMPRMDGVELCRRVKARENAPYTYLIIETIRGEKEAVSAGLDAGADDYMVKPIDRSELRSRVMAGERILRYEKLLSEKITELERAIGKIKTLSGLLPICSSCHKIRDDRGYWNRLEEFIRQRSEADFTHSLCPDCVKKLYPDTADGG